MNFELKNIMDTLKDKYGKVRTSQKHGTQYVAIDKLDRKEFLGRVALTMKLKGKDKTYFQAGSIQDEIAEYLIPEAVTQNWDRKKTKNAHSAVKAELDWVLAQVWPEEVSEEVLVVRTPEPKKEQTAEPVKEFVAERMTESPYKKDRPTEVLIDEEFAKLIGAKPNGWTR